MSIVNEKVAICQFCSGETYRESALDNLNHKYVNNDNFYYFVLTDDKSYFKSVTRKNFIVNEIKDFFLDYPLLEINEPLIYAENKNEYAKKFIENNYKLSFSLMRFHLLQALKYKITNVAMICTDTFLNTDILHILPPEKNRIYNAVSEWDSETNGWGLNIICDYLKKKYNYDTGSNVRVLDAAGRLFRFENLDILKTFFNVWNNVIEYLYESKFINTFHSSYVINDEYILAPIYKMFGLNLQHQQAGYPIFEVNHNILKERYWRTSGFEGLQEHWDYEKFLKINNLST